MKGVSTVEFLIIVGLILIIASVILFVIKSQSYESVSYGINQSAKSLENVSVSVYEPYVFKNRWHLWIPQKSILF